MLQDKWSREDITRLIALGRTGAPWKEVGRDLKKKPTACHAYFSRLAEKADKEARRAALDARGCWDRTPKTRPKIRRKRKPNRSMPFYRRDTAKPQQTAQRETLPVTVAT